jgi:hypothetical protein
LFHDRYSTPAWQAALSEFPDRHAVGRWWRVALRYWCRAAQGKTDDDMRNDWADSIYVFTVSYADEFWTADKKAARIVKLLFPNTEVVKRTTDQIRALH